jgi:TolA-binding protein
VLDAIAEHREIIAEDPKHRDVPAYRLAIANLYIVKLGDYESASLELEELLSKSPESNLSAQAYAKLGKCYEGLGWRGVADNVYKRMAQQFPEGSPTWEYARAKRRGDENIY